MFLVRHDKLHEHASCYFVITVSFSERPIPALSLADSVPYYYHAKNMPFIQGLNAHG